MLTGQVINVQAAKGYGFIKPDNSDKNIFFHMSKLRGGLEFGPQLLNCEVSFEVVDGERGPQAANVTPVE